MRIVLHLLFGMLATIWLRRRPAALAPLRQRWYQRALAIAGVEVHWTGPEPGRGLLVSNHVSWLDIPVIGARLNPLFVAKAEIARWPVIGPLARWNTTLFLRRGASETTAMREQISTALRASDTVGDGRVLVFPEGTTSDGRQVLRFHPRLFAPAADDGHSVQPLAIRYRLEPGEAFTSVAFIRDVSLLSSLWNVVSRPVTRVDVTMAEPLTASGVGRDALAQQSAERVATALGVAVVRRSLRDIDDSSSTDGG